MMPVLLRAGRVALALVVLALVLQVTFFPHLAQDG